VSVVCITYNHEKYIEETLQGFCRQNTDFEVEFIVADDCSTDRTADIVRRYAAKDSRIVPILHKKNLGVAGNFESAAARARGDYVALCEGDDYWIDPTKLQRQADQLDQDRDLSIVFHPVEVFNDADGKFEYLYPATTPDLTIWELVFQNYIQTNSVMYRWRFRGGLPDWFDSSILPLDWYLHLCHAEVGKIGYLARVMAKYRKHEGGIWSSAASEPLKLWRRYGLQQLRLFKAVSRVAGGMFADHTNHTFDYLLREIFLDALVCDDADRIRLLVDEHEAALVRLKLLEDARPAESGGRDDPLDRMIASNRISVVVLSYNHASYIEQCLTSVLQQKGLFELEVIVGDDHSTDDTLSRIRAITKGRADVKVLESDQNIGMLENMRRCLTACTGNFIAFCEGDDYWLGERKLIRQLAQLRRDPSLAMSFNWVLLEHELDGKMVPHPEQAQQPELIPTSVIARIPLTANFSCCMYRADAVGKIPDWYFEEKGNADWMFNMHVLEWGGVAFLKELHSVYRLHSKGQWTGLSSATQSELFDQARQKCSQLIGLGRGFDDYGVTCFVEKMNSAASDRFDFHIDQPQSGTPELLEAGCLRVSGWAVDKRGKSLAIRLGDGDNALVAETHVLRTDVSRSIAASTGAFRSPKCGFDLRPRFDLVNNELDVYILCDGKEYRVATITAFLSPKI
jgi:glycosyltransferase involved in cell wall biosynthesis